MLPLGLRVQDKIEKLIDKHMQSLGEFKNTRPVDPSGYANRLSGASKLALSSLSAQSLWEKTGRLTNGVSEVRYRRSELSCIHRLTNIKLFRLTDRKDHGFLLCPTHEEEITSLVARNVTSYRDMPLKLYQISESIRLSSTD